MADLRISELAALAGGDLAAGDLLAIADVSASETKKITVVDLVGNATTLIADATIPSAKILFGARLRSQALHWKTVLLARCSLRLMPSLPPSLAMNQPLTL
jgi:hypothetical protein